MNQPIKIKSNFVFWEEGKTRITDEKHLGAK